MPPRSKRSNPYIAGPAVRQERGFFDREGIMRLVEMVLSEHEQNAIVLFGQRRIGKTSILLQLERRLPASRFLATHIDLMDRANVSLGELLYTIATTIGERVDIHDLEADQFDNQGAYFRHTFLPILYARLGEERDPVLLLDELDVLDVNADESLPSTAAAHAFFPYLRDLLKGEPRLKFVFVVGRPPEYLSINVKETFSTSRSQRISVLDEDGARELITSAETQGMLRFEAAAIDRILELTLGHPYLTQLICQILWDNLTSGDRTPFVDIAAVDEAAESSLEFGQNIFEWIWDGLEPTERLIFSAIAAATEQQPATEQELIALLQEHGVRILVREMDQASRTLIEQEMLRKTEGGYQFFIELMRRWIATHKPLAKVKDELNQVKSIADTLYQSALECYRQEDYENAEDLLRRALGRHPNHLQARLLLGRMLREQERADAAIEEFEAAYSYDKQVARNRLVEALLYGAQEARFAGDDDAALARYERVTEISPREAEARQAIAMICSARAELAIKAGDFVAAQEAYKRAGMQGKLVQAEALQRKKQAAEQARAYERDRQWTQAIAIYQLLAVQYPEEKPWRSEIGRLRVKQLDDIVRSQVNRLLKISQATTKDDQPAASEQADRQQSEQTRVAMATTAGLDSDTSQLPNADEQEPLAHSLPAPSFPPRQPIRVSRSSAQALKALIAISIVATGVYLGFAQAFSPGSPSATATIIVSASTRAPPAPTRSPDLDTPMISPSILPPTSTTSPSPKPSPIAPTAPSSSPANLPSNTPARPETLAPTPTVPNTPTDTITPTVPNTPTDTITPMITITLTSTLTDTITPTFTDTPTDTLTPTFTDTSIPTLTDTPTGTATNTPMLTATNTLVKGQPTTISSSIDQTTAQRLSTYDLLVAVASSNAPSLKCNL